MRTSVLPKALRAVLVAVLVAAALGGSPPGPAAAEGTDTPKKPKRSAFDFGPETTTPAPPPTTSGTPARPANAPASSEDPTVEEIRAQMAALATWPDRAAVHAAESLLLRGRVAIDYLVEALSTKESPLQPGAAWVLGKIGEPAHVVTILRAAAERSNGSRAEEFFEAAYGLDPVRTKDWLFSFIAVMGRPVFREKATTFLAANASADDRDRVLRLLDAPKPEVRVSGLRLLDAAKVTDASERLVQALSDIAPDVASAATGLLATRSDPAMGSRLNALARDGDARERSYATLALVEVARASAENAFEPATLADLSGRRGLLHPEKLVRGSAAIGLAYGGLASSDPSLAALLDGPVVDVLIDTVGGDHFMDYTSLVGPSFAALRRLAGQDLPAMAPAWAQWWQTQRGSFHARRPLTDVTGEDSTRASVRFDVIEPDGRRRRAVFVAEDGVRREGALVLPRPAFLALVEGLRALGLFDAVEATKARADAQVMVTLVVGNQEKRLLIPASDPRYDLARMRLDSLEEANLWQRYRDPDEFPDAAAWWRTNQPVMAEADPAMRKSLLQSAIVQAYDDLADDSSRAEAVDRLEALEVPLSVAQARALAKAVAAAPVFGATEARAMRFVLAQPSAQEARGDFLELLSARVEPEAIAMTADLMASQGAAAVRDAFADVRPPVRAAAARAATRLLDAERNAESRKRLVESFRPGLEVLSKDDDRAVAVAALLGLARSGDVSVMPRLETLYKGGDMTTKIAVAEACGSIPGDAARPLLLLMVAEERAPGSGALRAAALRSLGRIRRADTPALLGQYLLNDADAGVQRAAGEAMVDLGTDEARFFLVDLLTRERQPDAAKRARLLDVLGRFHDAVAADVLRGFLEDPDAGVATIAALRLSERNDSVTVPYLLRLLKDPSPSVVAAAIAGLENVTSVRMEVLGSSEIAERYAQWYSNARAGNDRSWFRDALRRKGYDVGPLSTYVEGEGDPTAVPTLVRALRDDDPILRRNAGIALERITGRSFGSVDRGTSQVEAARVADQWTRWWEAVNAGR